MRKAVLGVATGRALSGLSNNAVYQEACTSAAANGITLGLIKDALDKRLMRVRDKALGGLPKLPTSFAEARAWLPPELRQTVDGQDWLIYEGTVDDGSHMMLFLSPHARGRLSQDTVWFSDGL